MGWYMRFAHKLLAQTFHSNSCCRRVRCRMGELSRDEDSHIDVVIIQKTIFRRALFCLPLPLVPLCGTRLLCICCVYCDEMGMKY